MKKIFTFLCIIVILMMPISVSDVNHEKGALASHYEIIGNTLYTEWGNNQVIEIDSAGNEIWNITGLNIPHDAERLENGNTLITVYGDEIIIEVNEAGGIVWKETGFNLPVDAERLPNGNTLISEYGAGCITEIDTNGAIVWQKTDLHNPHDVERLSNGNTLVAEAEVFPDGRVIEIDPSGNIVWLIPELNGPVDIERLENGNTLITEHVGKRVIEVDFNGDIIWELSGLKAPKDAERLPNGNTLIVECGGNRLTEVDSEGNEVWNKTGLFYPVDVERIPNQSPSVDIINPKTGYMHFSGIPLKPKPLNIIADTISIGGFRLYPVIINATDDIDNSEDLKVNIYLNGEYEGNASFCYDWKLHEWFWTGLALGVYNLTVTVEDSFGAIGISKMDVFNFCFIP